MQPKKTTVERIRANKARNLAAAAKRVEGGLSLDAAMEKAVADTKSGEASCRVFAVAMRAQYGPGWYRLLDNEANGDNEKAIKKALQERRIACRNRGIDKGLSNPGAPWLAMVKCARELDNPYGETRDKKPLTQRVRTGAEGFYKAIMKAEEPSEKLMEANVHFAAILALFGVDISAINAKL